MATTTEILHVPAGNAKIPFQLRRAARRTMSISVMPDTTVSVIAPERASVEEILEQVGRKVPWIVKQQRAFETFLPLTPPRRYLSGETHLYLGREYRLRVESGPRNVQLSGGRLIVTLPDTEPDRIEKALKRWYRKQAQEEFSDRVDACFKRFATEDLPRPVLSIRELDRRWGSMSSDGARLLLNTRLIKADRDEIDYVIVHELCHIVHPNHGPKFLELLQKKLPDWQDRKLSLEKRFA